MQVLSCSVAQRRLRSKVQGARRTRSAESGCLVKPHVSADVTHPPADAEDADAVALREGVIEVRSVEKELEGRHEPAVQRVPRD